MHKETQEALRKSPSSPSQKFSVSVSCSETSKRVGKKNSAQKGYSLKAEEMLKTSGKSKKVKLCYEKQQTEVIHGR